MCRSTKSTIFSKASLCVISGDDSPEHCSIRKDLFNRVIIKRGRLVPHALSPDEDSHWLAGMVTTGPDPVTPVSAIENSSMMMPKVYFDWMSVAAIQNHRRSY